MEIRNQNVINITDSVEFCQTIVASSRSLASSSRSVNELEDCCHNNDGILLEEMHCIK